MFANVLNKPAPIFGFRMNETMPPLGQLEVSCESRDNVGVRVCWHECARFCRVECRIRRFSLYGNHRASRYIFTVGDDQANT